MQDGLRPDLPAVLGRVRARGATTSIDPNADPTGTWDAGLRDLLPMVNVFLPNAAEVRAIAGVDDVRAAAAALAVGGTTVVVKDADAGALVATADGIVEGSAFAVDAVDATGAGDSFDAGFLTATMDGRSVRDALRWANACGALSTRAYGGTDAQPTRSEIEGLLG
jgi:sugar/nucleoside kinase (ribokinase family)